MKIKDGSISVLVANYSANPTQPNYVAVGYKFKDSIYTIKDFASVVASLNQSAGWHYKNRPVNIGGTIYNIAEVYEENIPLRTTYKNEDVNPSAELFARLNQSCLPVENLGIPEYLTTYVPAPVQQETSQVVNQQPVQQTEQPTAQQTEQPNEINNAYINRWKQYITDEELGAFERKFGDLNKLWDEELEQIEDLYEERRSNDLEKQLVTYELPEDLKSYNLVYREAVLGKSFLSTEGETEEELSKMKHEMGLKDVVEAMINEIPTTEKGDVGGDDSGTDLINTYTHLGPVLDNFFMRDPSRTSLEKSFESEIHRLFLGLKLSILQDIKNKYGSYSEFIDQYLNIKVGEEINPKITAQYKDILKDVFIVKTYDNVKGYGIGFVTETERGLYTFPYALFYMVSYFDSSNELRQGRAFTSVYNDMLDVFFKQIGITGLNLETMKLSTHDVQAIQCSFLGYYEEEGSLVYIFKHLGVSAERYFIVNKDCIANKLLGSKYVLQGDNFEINYLGDRIIVAPKTQVILDATQITQLLIANIDFVTEPYVNYTFLSEVQNVDAIENRETKSIIKNYNELLGKTWNLGYRWNVELMEIPQNTVNQSEATPTQDPFDKQVDNVFAQQAQEVQFADVFGEQQDSQPAQQSIQQPEVQKIEPQPTAIQPHSVFDKVEDTVPTEAIKETPLTPFIKQINDLYEKLDEKDKSRMLAMLRNTVDIFSMDF